MTVDPGQVLAPGGAVITGHEECAAVYELEHAGLIQRNEPVVSATPAGRARLTEWAVHRG